jgi:hypothetical protein
MHFVSMGKMTQRTLWAQNLNEDTLKSSGILFLQFYLKKHLLLHKPILKGLWMTIRQCADELNLVFSTIFT